MWGAQPKDQLMLCYESKYDGFGLRMSILPVDDEPKVGYCTSHTHWWGPIRRGHEAQ